MGIQKNVKGPVRLALNTKDEEEFEILKKIILEVTYLDLISSALKLWFKPQELIIAVIHSCFTFYSWQMSWFLPYLPQKSIFTPQNSQTEDNHIESWLCEHC